MEAKISQIRKDILLASYEVGACHIGSALSCVPIMVDLFYKTLKKDDIFLFSKASGVATYYAILADKGYFKKTELAQYLKNYPLPSTEVPGVFHSFGSLGHGLPVACGIAIADRTRNVHVLLSDGECQEGSTMEAVLFARQHKLNNLHIFVDNNKFQANGKTQDILDLSTMFHFMKESLPNCTILDTVKGHGIDFMESDNNWHYKNLTKDLLDVALAQV